MSHKAKTRLCSKQAFFTAQEVLQECKSVFEEIDTAIEKHWECFSIAVSISSNTDLHSCKTSCAVKKACLEQSLSVKLCTFYKAVKVANKSMQELSSDVSLTCSILNEVLGMLFDCGINFFKYRLAFL
jgi:hypothetical protein